MRAALIALAGLVALLVLGAGLWWYGVFPFNRGSDTEFDQLMRAATGVDAPVAIPQELVDAATGTNRPLTASEEAELAELLKAATAP